MYARTFLLLAMFGVVIVAAVTGGACSGQSRGSHEITCGARALCELAVTAEGARVLASYHDENLRQQLVPWVRGMLLEQYRDLVRSGEIVSVPAGTRVREDKRTDRLAIVKVMEGKRAGEKLIALAEQVQKRQRSAR